jgi:hypothetical protein
LVFCREPYFLEGEWEKTYLNEEYIYVGLLNRPIEMIDKNISQFWTGFAVLFPAAGTVK